MKKIIAFVMCLVLFITSIPIVSLAFTNNQENSTVVLNELSSAENSLIENNELTSGIYINEKSREFFSELLTSESYFSITENGYLLKNPVIDSMLDNNYNKIVDYVKTGRKLIISISDNDSIFENNLSAEEKSNDYVIIVVDDDTDIVVFDATVLVDYDELLFYDDLKEIVDYIEDREQFENGEVTSSEESNAEVNENTTVADDSEDFTNVVTDENKNESSVETTNDEQYSDEDKSDFISEEETNSDDPVENVEDDEKSDSCLDNSVMEVSSDKISQIRMSAFAQNGINFQDNSIYVCDELIDYFNIILNTWYDNEYILSQNEIIINPELILNSSNVTTLDDGVKYIFIGQDEFGNMLSVKLSDNISKTNGLLQLMNSNYNTTIISFDQLEQNGIATNDGECLHLLYCGNQLIIAINSDNINFDKNSFNNIINSFLDTHKINKIQPLGIAVGNPIVYSGPGKESYAAVGSLNPFDSYETKDKELGFQYIEYVIDGTETRKRGYIDQYGGGSGTIPASYSYDGQGGNIISGCTVYSGPYSGYSAVGSVSSGESVTLLAKVRVASNFAYWYLEYSSSSGTKRGYVSETNITTKSNTGLGVTLKDIEVYDDFTVNSGSLYTNEYFVITGKNDLYYKIEYNTLSGRKTGYVHKSDVTAINLDSVPNVPNSSALQATPRYGTNIYAGPSSIIYANIGSVYTTDTVGVLGIEEDYYYIQYSTSSGPKRGYIYEKALNQFSGSNSVKNTGIGTTTAYAGAASTGCTVYSCPTSNSAIIGSIGALEGITVFPSIRENGYTFVEYSTSSNTKRGFISTSLLTNHNDGVKAQANKDIDVYYTTNVDLKIGSIFNQEYVIILGKTNYYYYIEYNSPSGRKRGYTVKNSLDPYSTSGIKNIPITGENLMINSSQNVYSGPASTYANIGSVSKNEITTLLMTTRNWYLIEYVTSNGNKQGYVPTSSAATIVIPINSEIDYRSYSHANQHKSAYKSGLGKDLIYYTIGDMESDNVLFLNFAIHGHEDALPGDGMTLVELAFETLTNLNNDYSKILSNNWLIVVIPTFNPDGILDGDDCGTYNSCQGIGRHNAVQMQYDSDGTWVKYTDTPDGKNALGHIDLNRCFPFSADRDDFVGNESNVRYYTGPKSMMAYEAAALDELLQEYKTKAGKKYFIDIHGWYNQIIVDTSSINSSPIGKALYDNGFNFASRNILVSNCSYRETYTLTTGNGYVAKYAHALGYTSCLFELPADSNPLDLSSTVYESYFINAVRDMVGI